MLIHYLRIACRILFKHKGYSFLNILGLAAGLACCILLLNYIHFELSYDTYHKDADRIFRVSIDKVSENGTRSFACNSLKIVPILREDYPQIDSAFKMSLGQESIIKRNEIIYYETVYYSEPEMFDVFSLPFILGDPETALHRPYTAVLTEDIASKYFGKSDPVGRSIQINGRDFEITGVIAKSPVNTHLKFSIIGSYNHIENNIPENIPEWQLWNVLTTYTYVKLRSDIEPDAFEMQIRHLPEKYVKEDLDNIGTEFKYHLQPVSHIHLRSNLVREIEPPGSIVNIYVLSCIAILILLIACINFINLTTARTANRTCEVGIRKVTGAQRWQLICQFMGESMVISFLASILGVIIAGISLPLFNRFAGTQFNLNSFAQPDMITRLLGLALFTGIAGGSYPAFFLSAFKPVSVLRARLSGSRHGSVMRKGLVVGQFVFSIVLIIATIIVYQQLDFMKDYHLGFDIEQKFIIKYPRGFSSDRYETAKHEFLKHPSIKGSTSSYSIPGGTFTTRQFYLSSRGPSTTQSLKMLPFDYDFISVYDIQMVAGRSFRRDEPSDTLLGGLILNEAAVKFFDFSSPEEAIGKTFIQYHLPVIGVTEDFHFSGLHETVEPLMMALSPFGIQYITLKMDVKNLSQTIAFLKEKWSDLFPNAPLEYFFLDQYFDMQYRSEEQLGRVMSAFTGLGILIACIGLFGLVAYIAEQRKKEIGIRKILGASPAGIIRQLMIEFVRWVFIATLVAWPIAYFAARSWLQNFAISIELSVDIFIISGLSALCIAVMTVSYQALKAARGNPVEALRYE